MLSIIGDVIIELIGGLFGAMVEEVRNPCLRAVVILLLLGAVVGCIVLVAIVITP